MLGTGRPFAIEVVNPRSQVLTMDQCASLQATINATSSNVRVRDVQPTSKVDVALMHEGATAKRKQYLYVKPVTLNLVASTFSVGASGVAEWLLLSMLCSA